MHAQATVFSSVPDRLLGLLRGQLPSSLTLLRRLQFARRDACTNLNARTIFASDDGSFGAGSSKPKAFAVAHADLFYGPNTHLFLYSSLECQRHRPGHAHDQSEHEAQLAALVETLIRLRREGGTGEQWPGRLILGSLHSDVRAILQRSGRLHPPPWGRSTVYDKWMFQARNLPRPDHKLPEGMHWGRATFSDCQTVASRSHVLRTPDLLVKLPNLMIKLQDETPIAWGFMGMDGSMISLYCEDAHRRNGLAQKLAIKLLEENTRSTVGGEGDEWASADVTVDNEAAQGVCRALNGQKVCSVTWNHLDISDTIPN